jgi:hypothetical protein
LYNTKTIVLAIITHHSLLFTRHSLLLTLMSLDFQQIRHQVQQLGENAPLLEKHRQSLRDKAHQLLTANAQDLDTLRGKVDFVAGKYDNQLRCALPISEPLDARMALPAVSQPATLIAADGSQINLDRHAEVQYCLVNVGAIHMRAGSPQAPATKVECQLLYGTDLYTRTGLITDAALALQRDLNERKMLAELAQEAEPPVITFTDGQMELWLPKTGDSPDSDTQGQRQEEYIQALKALYQLDVITAGYVDKPGSRLVVRLLELASLTESELAEIKERYPLQGLTDRDIYLEVLAPWERSAVFAIHSPSAKLYKDEIALHFFYLNVGRAGLARVEIPAWVAISPEKLDALHAALIEQCRIMGPRPYPYLLHRAHEVAVVSIQEKEQVTQWIAQELRQRGVPVGERSFKQSAKDLPGKGR